MSSVPPVGLLQAMFSTARHTTYRERNDMSFQAYLDGAEKKTGKTPQELVDLAHGRGFDSSTKAGEILSWLADDFGLGRGHGMALVQVIKNGSTISDAHVGTTGTHRDASTELRLDGIAAREGTAPAS
jgi:hypothetical protein